MSRFTDKNHEYNELCFDKIGIDVMRKVLEEIIHTNKEKIVNILNSYNYNMDYRVFEISTNSVMVINKSDTPKLYFCIGYPFPIYSEETNVEFIYEYLKKLKIEVKIFVRGSELRIEQKNYMKRFLDNNFENVKWNNINAIDSFSNICDKKIKEKINSNRFYFDPYAFIGDSILGLSFVDWFNQKYGKKKFVVFSKAAKHLGCFFDAYSYKDEEINKKITSSNLILMPDLIDNHFGKTLNTLKLLKSDSLILILGRNILIEIHNKSCIITNLVANDVLLLNQNINDYMFDCIKPFFTNKENIFVYNGKAQLNKGNGIFINPFSSTKDKDFSVEFVIELVKKINKRMNCEVYISAGDGSERISSWIDKFNIYIHNSNIKNVEILLDKGLADLGNKLLEKVGICVTTDTAISHLITRLGILNITIYKEGFWDIESLQSLSAESPIGFCSYNTHQFIAILNNDNFDKIINSCAEAIYFIHDSNNFSQISKHLRELANDIEHYLNSGNEKELVKITNQYKELENNQSQVNWIFNLYNPIYFVEAIRKINSIYYLKDMLKSVWQISNIYKYVRLKGGEDLKISKVRDIVEEKLSCSAHDLEHVNRVYNMSMFLAKDDNTVNTEILELAALLHDIARIEEDTDKTGKIDHAILGAEMARTILSDLGYDKNTTERVEKCIKEHRFRSGEVPSSKEAMILYDADKLDILGAIGIARSYMIAGEYGEPIYRDINIDEYIKENLYNCDKKGRIIDISKHSPNLEFQLKLVKIPEKLFTSKGKEIAIKRLNFMKDFYNELNEEIRG